ncbi:MAG: hypothetical protein NT084_14505 [Bacteroidetes bacterium]|nr:hypothetical protein [Bacteroidota bacterium]
MSERSDSKYCCDSHKTMACIQRRLDERDNQKRNKEVQRQRLIQQLTQELKTSIQEIKTSIRTTNLPNASQNQVDNQSVLDFRKSMDQMFEKTEREQKLRDEKYEFEKLWKQLNEIGVEFLSYSKSGSISQREIDSMWRKTDKIIDNEKIKNNSALQNHWYLIDDVISVYLDELEDSVIENGQRRMRFTLPEEVHSALQMLLKPVPFPVKSD